MPGVSERINAALTISGQDLHNFWQVLPATNDLTAGILLTGLAASAGSNFWHDLLGRIQSAKKQAESAAKLVKQLKDMSGQ